MKANQPLPWECYACLFLLLSAAIGWEVNRWLRWHKRHQATILLEDLRMIDGGPPPPDLITEHSDICEVHGVYMSVEQVPLIYGLLEHTSHWHRGRAVAPHARWEIGGGCVGGPDTVDTVVRTYICPKCVELEEKLRTDFTEPVPEVPSDDH